MRVVMTALVVTACTPPQFEIDVFVSPTEQSIRYRGAECEARPQPQPGECVKYWLLEGDVRHDNACTETCLTLERDSRDLVISGCGGEARASVPTTFPTLPTMTVTPIGAGFVLDVHADPTVPTFTYDYLCQLDEYLCRSTTSGETIRGACDAYWVGVTSDVLSETGDTELGRLRVWARQSAIYMP
jgi:hypothetical protein